MPLRAPKNFLEWLLLFSPALVVYAAVLISISFPAPEFEWGLSKTLMGGLVGSAIASAICVVAGYVFTKPTSAPFVRPLWSLLTALLVGTFNIGVILTASVLFAH
jgi:hypothetical protein